MRVGRFVLDVHGFCAWVVVGWVGEGELLGRVGVVRGLKMTRLGVRVCF